MPTVQKDDIFDLGADLLGTTQNERGTFSAQTGDVVGEDVYSPEAEIWGALGLASRPAKATAGKDAAQAVCIKQGSNDVCIAYRDVRAASLYGPLREGETCLYAPGPTNQGTGRVLLQDDGSGSTITITAGGQTVVITGGKVNLGTGAAEGVVCGGSAFSAWASAITAAIQALLTAVATKSAVVGAPIDPSVTAYASGLTFPTSEISTVVQAAT